MKKTVSLLSAFLFSLCAFLVLTGGFGIDDPEPAYVTLIHTGSTLQTLTEYPTLADAFKAAKDNDVIEVFDQITVSEPIVLPKNVRLTLVSGSRYGELGVKIGTSQFVHTNENATVRTVSRGTFQGCMFVIPDSSALTVRRLIIDGCNRQNGSANGGLFRVSRGASLVLSDGANLRNSVLSAADSCGGAVYVENGGSLSVNKSSFSGNVAATGTDIFADYFAALQIAPGTNGTIARGTLDLNRDGTVDIRDFVSMKKNVASGASRFVSVDLAALRYLLLTDAR